MYSWILITGCARSGTTWVNKTLNKFEEMCFIEERYKQLDNLFIKNNNKINYLDLENAKNIAIQLCYIQKNYDDVIFFGQKNPFPINPKYLKLIKTTENIKIINIHRHPLDVFLSMKKRTLNPLDDFSRRKDMIDINGVISHYKNNFNFVKNFDKNNIIDISYEELNNSFSELVKIFDFLKYKYDKTYTEFTYNSSKKNIKTDSELGCYESDNRKEFKKTIDYYNHHICNSLKEELTYWNYRL